MTTVAIEKKPVTFTPQLHADDAYANYWMRQVTIRLRREICWRWYERGVLPDASPTTLPPFSDKVSAILDMSRFWEEKNTFFQTDPTARYLTEQLTMNQPSENQDAIQGSFRWVVDRLKLDDISSFVLALGLSAIFDNAVGSIISTCLNSPACVHPNLALVQKLWDHPECVFMLADPAHPLFRYGLLQYGNQTSQGHGGIDWDTPITVPSVVAHQLLFPVSALPQTLMSVTVEENNKTVLTDTALLVAHRLCSKTNDKLRIVPICGPKGSTPVDIVHAITKITKRDVVEFKGDPGLLKNIHYMNSLATLCWLKNMDLFLNQHVISALSDNKQGFDTHLLSCLSMSITVFLGITGRGLLTHIPGDLLLPIVEIPQFPYYERIDYWKKMLGVKAEGLDGIIMECSRRFRYEKGTINAICDGLKGFLRPISEKDFIGACRAELEWDVGELAQKVIPRFEDEELILPHNQRLQFQEIIRAMKSLTKVHYDWGMSKVWNESGISLLFAGPPGTGKTMAAEILANKLDLPMYRIDLSQVVNKYIGETEKNLKRLFDAADVSDTILFFDEADALFGRRTEVKDAHDRYANLEISYLLERMERFKGLAILATNRKKDIDEAFLRRLRYILDFPLPDVEHREKIWLQVIPKTIDSSKIDFRFLAKQFQLAGGHIRSIVFNACLQSTNGLDVYKNGFKGQLTMEKIIIAVKREYEKLNRAISLEQFGPYAKIIERMEHE
ncbi:MAG: ATP-binding protein [Candidatus Jettenia sp.]|nr:MAG: ATP-binding protein [Candidatus Jettenia sp.]